MVPNASDLARRRYTVLGVLRVFAVLTWLATTGPVILMLSIIATGDAGDEPAIAAFFIGIGGGIVGLALWLIAPWLSERILPPPRAHACSRCGYDLRSITEPRCPECGTALTEEFLPDHVAAGPTSTGLGLERNAQLVVALIGRAIGILLVLGFGAAALGSAVWFIDEPGADAWIAALWLVYSLGGMLVGAVPLVFPRPFARVFVPRGLALPAAQPPPEPSTAGPPPHPPTTP